MAYRKPRRRSVKRRSGGRRKRTYVRSTRKRTYRKKGAMSKKRILDVTSLKKRDTMMPYTNTTAASQQGSATYTASPAIITGGYTTDSPFVWCATSRGIATNSGGSVGTKYYAATRTASDCYMKGIAENIEIQVSDGCPWQWRRICFTYKGIQNLLPNATGFGLGLLTSNGQARVVNKTANNGVRDALEEVLFKGAKFSDWFDQMTASLDNSRVTVKYDRTRTIASGNEDGVIRKYKMWHPMNKTLRYADDESGGGETTGNFSVQSKVGMGDYMIVDYFVPRIGSTSANQLSFSPQSTLYWHEK